METEKPKIDKQEIVKTKKKQMDKIVVK